MTKHQLTPSQKVMHRAKKLGLEIYNHKEWGSRERDVYAWRRVNRKHAQIPGKPTDTFVQHITVTRDSGEKQINFDADMRAVEAIGMARFGSGVSYNWVTDMHTGEIGQGMPIDAAGTHTLNDKNVKGYSTYTIAVLRDIVIPIISSLTSR